ncbi:FAD-dependent oxidoreductase [Nonomuraea sp. NPDC005650]|uniref:FAD-dependent oxidoreductase n=1 Tax=Nonomuraea sp. NPDC005650 TaxID=3157045 RepID=UPI0033AF82A7
MTENHDYDLVVVGAGPVGLAAAYHATRAGRSVLVLERFNLFNQSGSSNDLTRMFRTMYTEDFMADLAKTSIRSWQDLELDAGERLILMSGLLNFGDPTYAMGPEGNLLDPIKNLKRLKMEYRVLAAAQIQREYPFMRLPETFVGLYAPDNGCIDVPLVLRTLRRLTVERGGQVRPHARVTALAGRAGGVVVTIGQDEKVTARKCVVACGAYTNDVLASLDLRLRLGIWEMGYGYFASDPGPPGTRFPSMWFQFRAPTYGDPALSNLFYGFPALPWGPPDAVRIAVDNAVNVITDPDRRRLLPAGSELERTAEFVAGHCVGVDTRPNFTGTCLQTNAVDNMYILDQLPCHPDIAVFTAGWAFKMVPLIGEILYQLLFEGGTPHDISRFSITRKGMLA